LNDINERIGQSNGINIDIMNIIPVIVSDMKNDFRGRLGPLTDQHRIPKFSRTLALGTAFRGFADSPEVTPTLSVHNKSDAQLDGMNAYISVPA